MERGEHLEHLRNCFFTAQIHFFEHKFSVRDGPGGAALALTGSSSTHKHVRLSAFCYIFSLQKSGATMNKLVHARPLLRATHGHCDTSARSTVLVAGKCAGAVGRGRVQEIA
jgi:hypothetical protein